VLRIRKNEKDALAAAQAQAYEDHVAALLRAHWPDACTARGEDGVRAFVHTWVEAAEAAGVKQERDIAHFVNVMFAAATDFDSDPRRIPWVRETLDDGSLTASGKIYRLYAELYAAYDLRKG
jgi:hypothetical protein